MSHSLQYATLKADNWLLHEDEFYVHWVGNGPNLVGNQIMGGELETDFFMYNANDSTDSESD